MLYWNNSKENSRQIDYGIPVAATTLSKENNISTILIISAMGANVKSKVFYNKTKGEMERDVLAQNLKKIYIFRPSLIGGERKERRILEKIGIVIFKVFEPLFIGKLKQYIMIDAETIAQAMINVANLKTHTSKIFSSDEIKKQVNKNRNKPFKLK